MKTATMKAPTTKAPRKARKAPALKVKAAKEARVPVTEATLRRAAARLLKAGEIVSVEIAYIQRTLGNTATQTQIDASVVEVRAMPWKNIVLQD